MKYYLLLILPLLVVKRSFSQHDHHVKMDTVKPSMKMDHHMMMQKKDSMPAMKMDHDMMMMTHSYSINLPMNRDGSGTSWLPDETPMYMVMKGKKAMWMFHGSGFFRYTNTDVFDNGKRGASKWDVPNWFMVMMSKRVGGKGLLSLKAMLSLDRIMEGGEGYPLLFQSGETYNGKRLVDRQHPHDLFSELSIGYSYAINKNTDVFAYFGYPGEPALGATAFMHRVSAMNNPDAPLGHHWQDATHITFGTGTLGFRYMKFKVEGSIFTGREPDEDRYDLDKARFDSYSYRLSYAPSKNWILQFSQGFIKEPEALEPGVDVTRTTASVQYSKKISNDKQYDAALIWGYNNSSDDHKEHSFLFENNYRFWKNALYSRYEFVQKSTEELDLKNLYGEGTYNINVFTAGYNRSLWSNKNIELAIGAQLTLNLPAKELRSLYGTMPVGAQVYFQVRPPLHRMH